MEDSLNSKQQWNTAKKKLGWTKPTGPKILVDNGKLTQSPMEMASILNKTYLIRAAELHRNIPKTNIDPLTNFNKLAQDKNLNFNFKKVDEMQVLQTLKLINPSNDGIPMKFISMYHKPLLKSIT